MASSHVALGFFLIAMLFMSPSVHAKKYADFFALVVMWPGAYCEQTNRGCCLPTNGKPPLDFIITGLKTYKYFPYLQEMKNCATNETFSKDTINNVIPRLASNWTNIGCPSADGYNLWKKAWKTHGTCSGYAPSDYLQLAVDLFSKADLLKTLSQAGIKPDYRRYDVTQIENAIADKLNVAPVIQCSRGPFDEFQLYQIYLCADTDLNFMECPENLYNFNCFDSTAMLKQALFYGFDYWMLRDCTKCSCAGAASSMLSTAA